ncbi:hypothetical protein BUE80_DR011735 [Diplocarpon rosae]|nr:hypothetical protein BUE80_DR011735 [Diplocarpon rosae]
MAKLSPMSWMLARARAGVRSHPPDLAGQPIKEFQVWMSLKDHQQQVQVECPNALPHVQQYLAECRTFGDFCKYPFLRGPENLHMLPAPQDPPQSPAAMATPMQHHALGLPANRTSHHSHETLPHSLDHTASHDHRSRTPTRSSSRRTESHRPRSRSPFRDRRLNHPHRSRSPDRRDWLRLSDRDLPARGRDLSVWPRPSWKSLAEDAHAGRLSPAAQAVQFLDKISNAIASPAVLPNARATHSVGSSDPARAAVTPHPHIDGRTGKPHPALKFVSQDAYSKMYGAQGQAMDEVKQFFPAVVVCLEQPPKSPGALVTFSTAILWFEVKGSSDPKDNGVRGQIDACRRGFEEYHKRDHLLPDVREFYYAHRQLFHNSRTSHGRYLQSAPRPRGPTEAREQLQGRRLPKHVAHGNSRTGNRSDGRPRDAYRSFSAWLGDELLDYKR